MLKIATGSLDERAMCSLTTGGPLLLLVTRRPEPDPGVAALEAALSAAPGLEVRRLELNPLADSEQRDLARALLGAGALDEVLGAVTEGAEGNPFFLEERLASLLETKALVKAEGRWYLDRSAPGQLPEAIERLVRSRVDRLRPGPRAAIVAASVLGPELTLGALGAVTDLDDLEPALAELCSAGLLVELAKVPEPSYRFRNALIQEATYKGLLQQKRRHLHTRAAWAMEEASAGRLEEVASVLGHHYALAGEAERAAHYLELAGDRAAAAFATDEAIASYRWALDQVGARGAELAGRAAELWLKLGSLFWGLGRYGEGRAALHEAGRLVPAGDEILAARSYRCLGQLEMDDLREDEAVAAFEAADARLEASADKGNDDWVETWLYVQLSRSGLHHWLNEPDRQAAVIARMRPMVEARGTPAQKADFYTQEASQRLRAHRFRADEVVVAGFRASKAALAGAGLENPLRSARWSLGFALLCQGDVAGAREELEGALGMARRSGDRSLELKCLTFLAWARSRQHDVVAAKEMSMQVEVFARDYALPEFAPMAKAILAWVAWKEETFNEA